MPATAQHNLPQPSQYDSLVSTQVQQLQSQQPSEQGGQQLMEAQCQHQHLQEQVKHHGQRLRPGQEQGELESAALALSRGKLGFAFGGSGFLVAYEIGVAERLRELGIITARTPVSGTSASALVAVAIACDIDFDDMLQALEMGAKDMTEHGSIGRFRGILSRAIDKLLPKDAHLLIQCNKAQLFLGATRTSGPCPACWHPTVLPSDFCSSEEVKEALLTVAHLPIGSDLRLLTKFRKKRYMDGGIRAPVVAIPASVASHVVRVYALPAKFLDRLWPYRLLQHPPKPNQIDIAPDKFGTWPYKYRQCSKMALKPQETELLDALRERGRQDGQRWASQAGLLPKDKHSGALPPLKRAVASQWQHLLLRH